MCSPTEPQIGYEASAAHKRTSRKESLNNPKSEAQPWISNSSSNQSKDEIIRHLQTEVMDLKLQLETLKSCQQDKIPNSLMGLIQDLRESIKSYHWSAQVYKKSFKEAKAAYKWLEYDMLVSEKQAKEKI